MPAAFVNKAITAASASATTVAVTPTAPVPTNGNTAYITVTSTDGTTTCVLKDNNNVSYTAVDTVDDAGNGTIMYSFRSPTGGIAGSPTSFTATFGAPTAVTFRAILYQEWSGVDVSASPLDGHNMALKASSATPTSNSITPAANGDPLIGAVVPDSGPISTIAAGTDGAGHSYTLRNSNTATVGCGDESQIQASAAAATASFTFNTAQSTIISITAFKAAAAGVVERLTEFKSRTFPVKWNLNTALFMTSAQDTSSFGVETNPHWVGKPQPPQWNISKALYRNPATDVPFVAIDTPVYFISRTYPVQWVLTLGLRQATAQDFSSFGVETNPHWTGRVWPLRWSLAVPQSPAVDVPAAAASDTPIYFTPRQLPVLWNLNRALGQTTANDLSSPGVETNQFFQPRTWAARWDVQVSLMRGTAQDFSSIVTVSQVQYITSLGGFFNPNPGGQAVG